MTRVNVSQNQSPLRVFSQSGRANIISDRIQVHKVEFNRDYKQVKEFDVQRNRYHPNDYADTEEGPLSYKSEVDM